jgi:protein-S-isoprenylcysteine O-methyltransferase Ste14
VGMIGPGPPPISRIRRYLPLPRLILFAALILLVLPAAVYRAGREEAALQRTFPAAWPPYRARTGAWLPHLRRKPLRVPPQA